MQGMHMIRRGLKSGWVCVVYDQKLGVEVMGVVYDVST